MLHYHKTELVMCISTALNWYFRGIFIAFSSFVLKIQNSVRGLADDCEIQNDLTGFLQFSVLLKRLLELFLQQLLALYMLTSRSWAYKIN